MIPAPAPAATRCPGCGGSGLTDVFAAAGVPVWVGMLHDTAEEARHAARGDITLAFCHRCGLVHNRRFDPARVLFEPGYDSALVHSPSYRSHLEALAGRLVDAYGLEGRTVLDIGCGGGHFLRLLARRGIGRGVGVDPALRREGREREAAASLEWVRRWFDPPRADAAGPWDFACSLSVFEDLPRPLDFARGLRRLCAARGAAVYVEVFHASSAFERGETWSVHYEQCNYFGPDSLAGLFERAGFHVRARGEAFADRHLFVEIAPNGARPLPPPGARLPLPPALAGLADGHRTAIEGWTARLEEMAGAGRRVVLWGSGGKGIGFLSAIPNRDRIAAVVDVNPARQGRWIPICGLPVLAPAALAELRPDVVILSNPVYGPEIRAQVASLGLTCSFVAA